MSATAAPAQAADLRSLKGRIGMACLIVAESSFFAIFVIAYLFYRGKSLSGPQPADVLSMPILASICLLSSSVTISPARTSSEMPLSA